MQIKQQITAIVTFDLDAPPVGGGGMTHTFTTQRALARDNQRGRQLLRSWALRRSDTAAEPKWLRSVHAEVALLVVRGDGKLNVSMATPVAARVALAHIVMQMFWDVAGVDDVDTLWGNWATKYAPSGTPIHLWDASPPQCQALIEWLFKTRGGRP